MVGCCSAWTITELGVDPPVWGDYKKLFKYAEDGKPTVGSAMHVCASDAMLELHA